MDVKAGIATVGRYLEGARSAVLIASERRYQRARLALFREHLRATVEFVSPLAVDALAAEGLSVDEVVEGFIPPRDWPEVPLRLHDTFRPAGFDFFGASSSRPKAVGRRFEMRHRSGAGIVVRGASDDDGGLGIRVSGDGIEVAILTSEYLLTTSAGKGRLQIAGGLPMTIGGAMTGRSVGEVVSHPLLDGRSYPVRRVTQSFGAGSALIVFDTGRQEFQLPTSR